MSGPHTGGAATPQHTEREKQIMNEEYTRAMMEALTPQERREYRQLYYLLVWQMTEEAQERLECLHEKVVEAL